MDNKIIKGEDDKYYYLEAQNNVPSYTEVPDTDNSYEVYDLLLKDSDVIKVITANSSTGEYYILKTDGNIYSHTITKKDHNTPPQVTAISTVYNKNDYRQLTLLDKYKAKTMIDSINSELKQYGFNENMKKYIGRINAIYNGTLKYDPKREFSTNPKSNVNIIYQRGNIEKYARDVLKLSTAGTNRQITGIYGRGNEEITVYVKIGNANDPLPSIIPTQFIGHNIEWYGTNNKLKEGKQSFIFNNFKLTKENGYTNFDDPKFWAFPGGPMYLINPFTPEEQSQNILFQFMANINT